MSLALQLAERISAMRREDLPPEAISGGKVAVLDTVGVTLAGSLEEAPRLLLETLALSGQSGTSLVFGTGQRTGSLDAALVNGTSAHVLDFDNATNTMFGHASATLIPALIAAGEACGAGGMDVLVAHAAGFETGACLGRGVNMHHYDKGWHPTSTLGVFAVAAACSRLLGLDAGRTATALALSTSLAAGIKANFGTMTKPLHVGQCARAGLMAALLARKGFTANPDAFEHKQGFFNAFNGAGNYDASRVLEHWGSPFDIVSPGACYKQYPSCASTHAVIDAALSLVRRHGPFASRDLTRVETWTAGRRLAHTNRPEPNTALEAKFSVQYCAARALLDGKVTFEHFEGAAYRDAAVRDLLARVHALPSPEGHLAPENQAGAEVKITLADGTAYSEKVSRPQGRTSGNPIPMAQMKEKFENCASRVLAPGNVAAVCHAVEAFDELKDLRDFTALLEPAGADAQRTLERG